MPHWIDNHLFFQLGGPDGELGAATRYLQQRYSMPFDQVKGMLTDIGTEELAHIEIVSTILYQLTKGMSICDIKKSGFDTYFIDHTAGVYPQAASGMPFSASTIQVTGDTIADLSEDLAAEQKARLTYDNILRLADDPDVRDPIKFLREREIVHFQRFGDALRITQDHLDAKNFYAFNPSFDMKCPPKENPCACAPAPAATLTSPTCDVPQTTAACGCVSETVVTPACGCADTTVVSSPCGYPSQTSASACGCGIDTTVVVPPCGCTAETPAVPFASAPRKKSAPYMPFTPNCNCKSDKRGCPRY